MHMYIDAYSYIQKDQLVTLANHVLVPTNHAISCMNIAQYYGDGFVLISMNDKKIILVITFLQLQGLIKHYFFCIRKVQNLKSE